VAVDAQDMSNQEPFDLQHRVLEDSMHIRNKANRNLSGSAVTVNVARDLASTRNGMGWEGSVATARLGTYHTCIRRKPNGLRGNNKPPTRFGMYHI